MPRKSITYVSNPASALHDSAGDLQNVARTCAATSTELAQPGSGVVLPSFEQLDAWETALRQRRHTIANEAKEGLVSNIIELCKTCRLFPELREGIFRPLGPNAPSLFEMQMRALARVSQPC